MQSFGPYELRGEIGRGGLGVVHRAFDPRAGREVALKVLARGALATPGQRERFLREARVQLGFDHPNLVRVHEAGERDGLPFLALELLPGGTLEGRLADGPLPLRVAVELVAKLARGLAHAHAQGVLHRDVKPSNVLFAGDGEPKLGDFGLATETLPERERLSRTGMLMGTPGWSPPEQAAGELQRIGPRSDVYGLGAVLYAALTGRPPFAGATLSELLLATSDQPAVPPSQLRPEVPPELDAVCLRCLAKRPEERPDSAAALAIELQRLLGSTGGPGRESGGKPQATSLIAAAALVGLGGLAAATLLALRGPRVEGTAPVTSVGPPARSRVPRVDVRPHLASAGELRAKGDLHGAEAALSRALELQPDLLDAVRARGTLRLDLLDHGGAQADFTRLIELDPESAEGWALRARARVAHDPQGAQRDCAEAFARQGGNAMAHAVQALVFRSRGKDDLAGPLLDRAVARDPGCDFAWTQLGELAGARGDWARAREAGERVVALVPGHPSGWSLRGRARARLGDAAGGEADLKQALRLHPESPDVLEAMADVCQAREPDRATVCRATAAWQRSRAATRAGRADEAEAHLTRSLELFPLLPASYLDRGKLRLARGDARGALADAEAGMAIARNEPELTALRDRARAALAAQPGG